MKLISPKFFITHAFLFFSLVINGYSQNLYINEFLASNVTTNPDNIDFDDYSDWIEIYNDEQTPVDLSGYYLTDNFNRPTKWRIPDGALIEAKGFIRFWADGFNERPGVTHVREEEPNEPFVTQWYHTDFSLAKEGEEIALYSPDSVIIDSVSYSVQFSDVSYGRQPDGSSNWFNFGEPTPGTANNTQGVLNTHFSGEVQFSVNAGFYDTPLSLVLTSSAPDAPIYYTLDGSKPGSSATLYTNPIDITATTVVRARVFEEDKLPGPVITQTYMIGEDHSLPVLSLAVFPETVFGEEFGIFPNLLKSREIPVSVEFFETNGIRSVQANSGFRLSGQAAFRYPQKPVTLSTDDRYGTEFFKHQFFPNRKVNNFTSVYLRNSGTPDNRITLFRDALQHTLVINQFDLDVSAYRPAATYINGEYYGIYNLREKLDEQYLRTYHNIDPDNVDILEFEFSPLPIVVAGDANHYNEMMQTLATLDMTLPASYEWIKRKIDLNSYLNFIITQIYCDNINTLNTNVRLWREKTAHGKWRWFLQDLDWGFGTQYSGFSSHYSHDQLLNFTSAPGTFLAGQWEWATLFFRRMLENQAFRNELIQRMATYINTVFNTERVTNIIDSLQQQIFPEMPRHIDRWDDFPGTIYQYPAIPDIGTWNNYVNVMRVFAQQRPLYQRNHITGFFDLSGTANVSISFNTAGSGKILINNIPITENLDGIFFRDIPLNMKAQPAVGYSFAGWEGDISGSSDSVSLILNSDISITAVFQESGESILPAIIESDTTLSLQHSPYLVREDLTVAAQATLLIEAGVEILMPQDGNIIVYGNLQVNGDQLSPVEIKPNQNSGALNWGALVFENALDTSDINYLHLLNATRGPDLDKHIAALSSWQSNLNIINLQILDAPFPVFIQYGAITIRNSMFYSQFTCDLINIKYAASALVENCVFWGSNSFDTDAIDYDQISNGIIRNNTIYNFYGLNNDGIDLGEGCRDIIIENNNIFNIFDKGISVGQASTAIIRNNVIINCGQGVGVKDDSSFAEIDHCTFYGNEYAVASFEKNPGAGGGNAIVSNSILSASKTAPWFLDNLSQLLISYSLSDTDELPGSNNLSGNPQFLNNLRLSAASPAINSGDPAFPNDEDGSQTDMGAFTYNPAFSENIIINEVHYNPLNGNNYEFIELYNSGPSPVNLTGYQIKDAVNFTFPSVILQPGEYIVIAADASVYSGNGYTVLQGINFSLPDDQAQIILTDNNSNITDRFSYSIYDDLPLYANGYGPSLELKSPALENIYYLNWRASYNEGGSPGMPNTLPLVSGLFINEIQAANSSTIEDEYGDFNDWIEIYNGSDRNIDLGGLYISDDPVNLTKYKIAESKPNLTSLKPAAFLVFWADDEIQQGELHLPFRLSASGEQLFLSQLYEDEIHVINSISFSDQAEDNSFGRTSDGSAEFSLFTYPTPGMPNTRENILNQGILLVNGVSFPTYGAEIEQAYQANAFNGRFPITFWDVFPEPPNGYPLELPNPAGHGIIPYTELEKYSTVIWIGNNYDGDISYWDQTDIESYLKAGGNLILLTRRAETFINPNLQEYLGIQWIATDITLQNTTAVYNGLSNISYLGSQSINAVFNVNFSDSESILLYKDTGLFSEDAGLGLWKKPSRGGAYKGNGGQVVLLSGRPYRYVHSQIKTAMEFFLYQFFEEKDTSGVDTIEIPVADHFFLSQNYPNPFNNATSIEYNVPHVRNISIVIYNILGQAVRTVEIKTPTRGINMYIWDGKNDQGMELSSGIYFYSLKAGKNIHTKKMIYIR
jgi:hypothetical protein